MTPIIAISCSLENIANEEVRIRNRCRINYRMLILLIVIFSTSILDSSSLDEHIKYLPEESDLMTEAAQALNHANTYYWYGRSKHNLLSEFCKSEEYIESFKTIVEKIHPDTSNFHELAALHHKASSLERMLKTIIPIASEKVNGRIPLYMELIFKNPEYETVGKIEESIVENTLDNLVELPYPHQRLGNVMFYDILMLKEADTVLYEGVNEYISTHTNHYLIGLHELAEILNRSNSENMSEVRFTDEDLAKIAHSFNAKQLGIIKIKRNDIVDGLYYYGAEFSTWSAENNSSKDIIYAEGFSKDKNWIEVERNILTFLLYLILTAVIIIFLYLVRDRLESKVNKLENALQAGLYFAVSLMAGFIILFAGSFFLSKIAPECDTFYIDPQVRYGWQLLTGLVFLLAPLIINYLVLIRFYGESLHKKINLFAFVAGSLSATPVLLFFLSYYKYEGVGSTVRYLMLIPAFMTLAYILALVYKEVYSNGPGKKKKEAAAIVFLLLSAVCLVLLIIQDPKHPDYVYLISGGFFLATGSIMPWGQSKRTARKITAGQTLRMPVTDVISLRKYFSQPEYYVSPTLTGSDKDVSFDEISRTLVDRIFISEEEYCFCIAGFVAPSGTGKTRFIKEVIAKFDRGEIPEHQGLQILYGDCDETHDTNAVPYEPFVQALGDELGVNRFLNPKMINSAISEQFENVHFEAFSAFASLIGGSKTDLRKGASEPELASEILGYFKKRCAKNRIILIIEDLQWMDRDSAALFENFLNQVKIDRCPDLRKLCIFLTLRSEDPTSILSTENQKRNQIIKSLAEIAETNNRLFRYINIGDIISLAPSDYFKKQAQYLRIDFQTTQKIQRLLEKEFSPMYVNELMINLVDRKWLIRESDMFTLSDEANLDELPPPGYLDTLFSEQLSQLNPEILQLLEIASFIGLRFHTRIVAFVRYGPENFDQNLLDVYYKLQEAEKLGIICDDTSENDAYEFTSKQLVSTIKDKYRRNRDEKDKAPVYLYQVVREYHKRIFEAYKYFYKDKSDSNPEFVRQLAYLSRSFDQKENAEQIIKYNEKAGDHYSETGNLQKASEFFEYLLNEIMTESESEHRFHVLDKLFQLYLDIGYETQKLLIKTFEREKSICVPPGIILKYSIALQRTAGYKEPQESYERINQILNGLDRSAMSIEEEYRWRFYKSHSLMLLVKEFSGADANCTRWRMELTDVITDLQNIPDANIEITNLLGEILNTLALSYARTKPPINRENFEAGKSLLDRRLQLLLKVNPIKTLLDINEQLEAMQKCLNMLKDNNPDLTRFDRTSMKYLFGYFKELFINALQPNDVCLTLTEMALEVNRNLFDYRGILLSLDPLSDLYSRTGNNQKALEAISEGLRIAETFKYSDKIRIFKIKMASFPIERQLHCLCHFMKPENDELRKLANQLAIENEKLVKLYDIPGSKFYRTFAKDPLSCLNLLRENLNFSIITVSQRNVFNIVTEFSETLYPQGIGLSNIVAVELLTEEERKQITQMDRDGFKVNVLKTEKKFITWKANLVIETDPELKVITLYPGVPAPPLPDPETISGQDLEESRKFWNQHILIK